MTAIAPDAPSGSKPSRYARWLRPKIILPTVLIFIAIVYLVTPPDDNSFDTGQLTSFSKRPGGAAGVYEMLQALGWKTSRQTSPFTKELDTSAVYVILAPPIPLTDDEDSIVARGVRHGARLIVASMDSSFLAPFGMWVEAPKTGVVWNQRLHAAGDRASRPISSRLSPWRRLMRPRPVQAWTQVSFAPAKDDSLLDDSHVVFLWQTTEPPERVDDSLSATTVMAGRRVGAGRVAVISYGMLLNNDIFADGRPGLGVLRAIEWMAPSSKQIIFDEYHQGYGSDRGNIFTVVLGALTDTPLGRVVLQLVCAALILLVAVGARAIPPTPILIRQRRSPLEHVDALARAYAQIHATRLGARRLMRGLRRRHPMGLNRTGSSEDTANTTYLDAITTRYRIDPQDTQAVTNALHTTVSDEAFLHAGQAIGRIEHSMTAQ